MKPFLLTVVFLACGIYGGGVGFAQDASDRNGLETSRIPSVGAWPSSPPQTSGLPYTRSGKQRGLAAIAPYIAVCAGSRYAYAKGYKIRLDDAQLLGGEAVMSNGKLYVPAAFAGVLTLNDIQPDTAPDFLKDRWIYTLKRSPAPANLAQITIGGHPYVDLVALAQSLNLKVYQNPRGFVLIGPANPVFNDQEPNLAENVVTLFDTPSKLVDPDIATEYIPRLRLQGRWTSHAAASPEQLKLLEGPEVVWPEVPASSYNLAGFNAKLLGSKVPPPGIYPRLLFSPEDVPMLYERMKSQKTGQTTLIKWELLFKKSWWDPKTTDGQVFDKLVAGKLDELKFAEPRPGTVDPINYLFVGQTPSLFNAYVNYNTNSLCGMALYCLLTNDEEHGRQAASAIFNYYRKIAPLLDQVYNLSDSESGTNNLIGKFSETGWRGMRHIVAHMDAGLALDFAGKWMTTQQKDFMRRIIAKATYGRMDNMQAAPPRLRDSQTTTWYLTNFIAASAIEGQEGCDPEVLAIGRESARAFLDWGIDDAGMIFEGNGVNVLGLQYQVLSMIILARRGDNLWGHPHWRKLLDAQVQSMSPNGAVTLSPGHLGGGPFSYQVANEIKAFYPSNLAADWILNHQVYNYDQAYEIDPLAYNATLFTKILSRAKNRVQVPGPSNPGNAFTGIYDSDWDPLITREKLALPLDFVDSSYGFLSSYSDRTSEAAWLALQVRSNQYLGAGLFHADVGMFYVSALGVNWITMARFTKEDSGKFHNLVLIANKAEPDGIPARGEYLGGTVNDFAAFATVDQTKSYSYEWRNLFEIWNEEAVGTGWEMETDPVAVAAYKGTQNYKFRTWAPNYLYTNWIPVLRRPWNPVEYAFRTAGLVRGAHPYTLVVDDVKKDATSRLYQWTAILNRNISQGKLAGQMPNEVFLVQAADLTEQNPKPGVPLLMVYALPVAGKVAPRTEAMKDGPINEYNEHDRYNRVTIDVRGEGARYRVLLIPVKMGDPLPKIEYDPKTAEASIHWPDQTDLLKFTVAPDNRTRFTISREGKEIASIK